MFHDLLLQPLGDIHGPLQELVALNSGVTDGPETGSRSHSFVPRQDWRAPQPSELRLLVADRPVPLSDGVSILKVDAALRQAFWGDIGPALLSRDSKASPEEKRDRLRRFAQTVTGSLETGRCLRTTSLRSCDVQVSPCGQVSTAFDYQRSRYVGLHIDDHDRLPMSERRGAFQLLCVNLGRSERYLQYINLGALKLLEVLRGNDTQRPDPSSSQELASAFLSTFPGYPVVRLRLPPDHAYIATTQNVLHDGATNQRGEPDVALLIAGFFSRHPDSHERESPR